MTASGQMADQLLDQLHVVGAVLREVVNAAPLTHRVVHGLRQVVQRPGPLHAGARRALGDGRLRPAPDDVVDGEVVAVDGVGAGIDVDHGRQLGIVDAPVVEERRVLPEVIGVVRVVHRRVVVADEEQQAVLELLLERRAPGDVDAGIEHGPRLSAGGCDCGCTADSVPARRKSPACRPFLPCHRQFVQRRAHRRHGEPARDGRAGRLLDDHLRRLPRHVARLLVRPAHAPQPRRSPAAPGRPAAGRWSAPAGSG